MKEVKKMISSSESLYIGIVSGILTSALIYLVVSVFEKIIIPWYQEIIYHGTDISGEWEATGENIGQTGVFNIEQKAHKIKGTATWVTNDSAYPIEGIRIFNIGGEISERFVTLILKHKDKRRLGIGSYLIQVVGDGRVMEGFYSFYSVGDSDIRSTACRFTRKEK
jgi:hypothetical protein